MLMEIGTNIGTFGSFKDVEACMRLEGHDKVKIIYIKAMFTTFFDSLAGDYTYSEIKQVIDTKRGLL